MERTKTFKSNCLIEAVRYKLKNWRDVKITYISPRINEVRTPHFLWSDGVNDYDFGTNAYLKWYQRFWFKGSIRTRELGFNIKYKDRRKRNGNV